MFERIKKKRGDQNQVGTPSIIKHFDFMCGFLNYISS